MSSVFGSVRGLKPSQRTRLERLGLKRLPADSVVTQEISRRLTELSAEIKRQIGLLVDRKGNVRKILVGDARSILIPKLDGWRVGTGRLRVNASRAKKAWSAVYYQTRSGLRQVRRGQSGPPLAKGDCSRPLI